VKQAFVHRSQMGPAAMACGRRSHRAGKCRRWAPSGAVAIAGGFRLQCRAVRLVALQFKRRTPVMCWINRFNPMQRLMVTGILLLGGSMLRADEPTYGELRTQFSKAYEAKDYEKALEATIKLHEMRPAIEAHIYNIACMNCLLDRKEEAYKWLDKLVEAGYKDADYLAEDDDFRTMRGEARFRRILEKIRGEKPDAGDS